MTLEVPKGTGNFVIFFGFVVLFIVIGLFLLLLDFLWWTSIPCFIGVGIILFLYLNDAYGFVRERY